MTQHQVGLAQYIDRTDEVGVAMLPKDYHDIHALLPIPETVFSVDDMSDVTYSWYSDPGR